MWGTELNAPLCTVTPLPVSLGSCPPFHTPSTLVMLFHYHLHGLGSSPGRASAGTWVLRLPEVPVWVLVGQRLGWSLSLHDVLLPLS